MASAIRAVSRVSAFISQESGILTPIDGITQYAMSRTVTSSQLMKSEDWGIPYVIQHQETQIQVLSLKHNSIPEKGMINLCQDDLAFTVKYWLVATEVNPSQFPDINYHVYHLRSHNPLLIGEHALKIKRTRYDLGDGTFREFYAHEKETGLIIERFYNRNNLWL